jgi:hypothetical protein
MDSVLNRPSTTIFYLKCACICDRESPCVYIVCASTLDFEVMNFLLVYECVGLFLRDHAPRALFYAVSTIVLTINFSYFAPNLPLLSLHTHAQEGTPRRNTRKHQEFIFCDVPSRSKENVLGKDHLLQRNSTRIFYWQDEINAYRGAITSICCLDYENVLGIPCLHSFRSSC